MINLGRISITHIILIYELIARVPEIKADQNSKKLPESPKKGKGIPKRKKM